MTVSTEELNISRENYLRYYMSGSYSGVAEDYINNLERMLEQEKEHAIEGWSWVDDLCDLLEVENVFLAKKRIEDLKDTEFRYESASK